jgi:DNA-binding NarL/FixJ family response regulator
VERLEPAQLLQEPSTLHPSLLSFLHPAPPPAAADAGQTQAATPVLTTVVAAHFVLVGPGSPLAERIAQILQGASADCRITRLAQAADVPAYALSEASLIVIDVDDIAGEQLTDAIRALTERTRAPLLALAEVATPVSINRALHAGAAGFLPKSHAVQVIESALRLMGSGGANEADPARRSRTIGVSRSGSEAELLAGLTERQRGVLLELARGASNLDISRRLDIREGTVKTHLFAIYRKLGVTNRSQAALFGMRVAELQQEQMLQARSGRLDLSWLQPEMSQRRMRAGQWIFNQGDVGSELFFVQRGRVSFPETGESAGNGDVFGEIGIFAPGHRRAVSARCETDVDLYTLSSGQMRRIYAGNPRFALFILTLLATRLPEDAVPAAPRPHDLTAVIG